MLMQCTLLYIALTYGHCTLYIVYVILLYSDLRSSSFMEFGLME